MEKINESKTGHVKYDIERVDPLAITENKCLRLFYEQHTERYKEARNRIKHWFKFLSSPNDSVGDPKSKTKYINGSGFPISAKGGSDARFVGKAFGNDRASYASQTYKSSNNLIILDAACGTGFGSEYLSDCGRYIGLDLDDSALERSRSRYPNSEFIKADLMKPGALDPFHPDVIVSFETLEHLPDPDLFLRCSHQALKKSGGKLICSAPIFKDQDYNHFHLHNRSLRQWRKTILAAGFKIEEELTHYFECDFKDFLHSAPDQTKDQTKRVATYLLTHPSYWIERIWWWGIKRKFRNATVMFVCEG